jgi:hypothetical protein
MDISKRCGVDRRWDGDIGRLSKLLPLAVSCTRIASSSDRQHTLERKAMKTIIMTGGTSGLGEIAAHTIAQAPNTNLIIGARRSAAG